jgi:hypothetical protein
MCYRKRRLSMKKAGHLQRGSNTSRRGRGDHHTWFEASSICPIKMVAQRTVLVTVRKGVNAKVNSWMDLAPLKETRRPKSLQRKTSKGQLLQSVLILTKNQTARVKKKTLENLKAHLTFSSTSMSLRTSRKRKRLGQKSHQLAMRKPVTVKKAAKLSKLASCHKFYSAPTIVLRIIPIHETTLPTSTLNLATPNQATRCLNATKTNRETKTC